MTRIFENRKDFLFLILAGFFITNAITAELISSKLIRIGPFVNIVGVIPWPIVFLATDIINEYYGRKAVQRLSLLTSCLILYSLIVVLTAVNLPAIEGSPATDEQYRKVLGQSVWVMIGSIAAFLVSQLVDVFIFWLIRERTGNKMIWLRTTGSTLVSQLVDSFVVLGIGFWIPQGWSFQQYVSIGWDNYLLKLLIAIALTPVIYLLHRFFDRYLGQAASHQLVKNSAEESLHHKVEE